MAENGGNGTAPAGVVSDKLCVGEYMRIIAVAALALALASTGALAQRYGPPAAGMAGPGLVMRGTIPYRTYGSTTGFGSVVFPGLGNPPPLTNPFSFPSTFAERLGATVSGFPGWTGAPSGGRRGRLMYPIPYPVFVGGYDPSYGYPYQQQAPNVTIVLPPQPVLPVAINQTFVPETATPVVREYGPGGQPAPSSDSAVHSYQVPARTPAETADDQILFLIALSDSSVYTAVAYWVETDTLHYVTPQGKHNQVSLDLVDRDVSARLNQGRNVEFRLPPPR